MTISAGRTVHDGLRDAAVVYDPFDYRMHEDPYPIYAWMREHAPFTATSSATSGRCPATPTCWPR